MNLIDLVKKAQSGCQESMDNLAQRAQHGLFAYIYRLTLNYNVAEDLQQETLLEMVRSLKTLEHPERFWAWLYRTALGKVQHYFRDRQYEKVIQSMSTLDKEKLLQRVSGSYGDGLKSLINEELSKAVVDAMAKLKLRHRNILVLRCCQRLPYSEIAEVMDCSELAAQVLFFRAKHSLKRKLSKHGFGKGMLLGALGLFGQMTAPSKAAAANVSVTAATLKVGSAATLVAMAASKTAIVTMATVGVVAVGTAIVLTSGPDTATAPHSKTQTQARHVVDRTSKDTAQPELSIHRSLPKYAPNSAGGILDTVAAPVGVVSTQNELPNLCVDSVQLVDTNGTPITPMAGERFWVRVNFHYTDPVCTYYTIRRTVDGWMHTAPPINWGCDYTGKRCWWHYYGPWVMHYAGTYSAVVTLDADNAIAELNESDNTATIDFSVSGYITPEWELVNAEHGLENLGSGMGVIVGIMGDAFDFSHPWYDGNDSNGAPRLVASNQNTLGPGGSPINADRATAVMGIVLAWAENDGDIIGLAPDARYVAAEFISRANEPNLPVLHVLDAVGFLASHHVNVIHMGWSWWFGDANDSMNGEAPITSLMADYLAYGRNIVCVAVLNEFEDYNKPTAPGSSRNVITVGGLDDGLQRAWEPQNHGPTLDGRCKPDLLGNNAANPVAASAKWRDGFPVDEGYSGTSFSAAFVTGAVAQMLDYGSFGGQNIDHRVTKAIIMNSGVKVFDANGAPWSNTTTQPLDDQQGTGVLNIARVYQMYSAGEQEPRTAAIPGYDFGEIQEITGDDSTTGYVVYDFGYLETPDANVDVTLVWDRHTFWDDRNNNGLIDANDSFFTSIGDRQDNLDLVLYADGVEIAASRSMVDNVEHISLTSLQPGHYELHVERLPVMSSGNSEKYAIAWYSDGSWKPHDR
jgi:RNA polymerase sigma-70 factor (ECF subfamily)